MVYYTLQPNEIIYHHDPKCSFREIVNPDEDDVTKTIDNFNKLYKWDGMFDLLEVRNRLRKNHRLFLFYFDNQVCGHVWFSKQPDKMGFLSEMVLPSQSIYCYNVFVDKTIHDKSWCDSSIHISSICKFIFADGYKKIHLYTDDWNTSAMSFFERAGFLEDDWTKTMF